MQRSALRNFCSFQRSQAFDKGLEQISDPHGLENGYYLEKPSFIYFGPYFHAGAY